MYGISFVLKKRRWYEPNSVVYIIENEDIAAAICKKIEKAMEDDVKEYDVSVDFKKRIMQVPELGVEIRGRAMVEGVIGLIRKKYWEKDCVINGEINCFYIFDDESARKFRFKEKYNILAFLNLLQIASVLGGALAVLDMVV
ncbi:hypothetical protein [Marinomonas sp. 2405UD68-3]|uniref:hypothetical protein n=1 Tax=Marinomonas sp. 2405UD68-3 TaxID=3391835 RepID=UPI0039C96432